MGLIFIIRTGIKKALQQPFKRTTTSSTNAATEDSSEFAYLEAQFRQKRESLNLLIKNIDAYPKQIKIVLREAQRVVEGLREILKKAQMEGRPSVWLGYSQKALVALLSLERDILPLLEDGGADLTGKLAELRKEYSEVSKKIQGRNSALLAKQSADKKREQKLRMQFDLLDQQLGPDLVRFLRKSEGLVQMTLNQQVIPFQERVLHCWEEALKGLELLNEPILHEELGYAITKIRSCLAKIPSCRYTTEDHYSCLASPLDVPTEGIAAEAPGSPKIQYKITMGSKDQLFSIEEAEKEPSKPISELRKSFEQLHMQNAPSTRAPELPSGQSRVAALAAQLEASKIIFRPMTPTVRPKPQRDTLDEAEEDGVYERNLGRPNPRGYGVSGKAAISHLKRKQEVPPKPPQKTYVYAMHDFAGTEKGDLQFRKGDKVELLVGSGQPGVVDWWTGRLHGAVGLFPSNYVRKL